MAFYNFLPDLQTRGVVPKTDVEVQQPVKNVTNQKKIF
jgi:hypothetical protein